MTDTLTPNAAMTDERARQVWQNLTWALIREHGNVFRPQVPLSLNAHPDAAKCKTKNAHAYTDGNEIRFDPAYLASLSREGQLGLAAEEVMHVQLLHPWRMKALQAEGISAEIINQAADQEALEILADAGIDVSDGQPLNPRFKGWAFEAIARTLYREQPKGNNGSGKGKGDGNEDSPPPAQDDQGEPAQGDVDPTPGGAVVAAPDESEQQEARIEAQMLAHDVTQGNTPLGLVRVANRLKYPTCRNLLAALLEWQIRCAGPDQADWSKPDRRRTQQTGLYWPGRRSRNCPPIAAAVDTSGSVDANLLDAFRGALQRVLDETNPERLTVFSADAAIHLREDYAEGDLVSGNFPGGGGTDFRPVFTALCGEDVAGLVYLTDGHGTEPAKEPDYPVLWAIFDPHGERKQMRTGTVIYLD